MSPAPRAAREAALRPAHRWERAIDRLGIKGLVTDSRAVQPGETFMAFPGEREDGRQHIAQALARGAASVLWEARDYAWDPAWRVPNVGIHGLRRHAGEIASRVYGRPSARLWMVGVTGTNGKTSCSHWIAQSLTRCGRRCAVIGTLGSGFPKALEPERNTTPDPVRVHGLLRDYVRRGARACAMEVSSHGLVQHRLSGIEFDVAMLTNVSRDHLDYHGTMHRYRAAKARLFDWPTLKWAVLNLDDPFGAELAGRLRGRSLKVMGYGFGTGHARRPRWHVVGRNLRVSSSGVSFDVTTPWGSASLVSALIGRFNAANLLGTLAVLLASDVGLEESIEALRRVKALPGRTERYGGRHRPLVVVDYAHTPDALEQVLRALREMTVGKAAEPRRLLCVFGCGGERDPGKRPLMGAIAQRLADHVVVTSDNPRGEDPLGIIDEIVRGMDKGARTIEPERSRAIRVAIGMARAGDIVLIAGKGHEQYQDIGGVKHPYSDAAEAKSALEAAAR